MSKRRGMVAGKVQRSVWVDPEVDKAWSHLAVELGVSKSEIFNQLMRREMGLMALAWQVIEDNGGGLHLAVLEDGKVIYYSYGYEKGNEDGLRSDLAALRRGVDPREDGWDMPGDVDDPQAWYDALRVGEVNGGVVVADDQGLYPDRMGTASRIALTANIDLDDYRTTCAGLSSDGGPEECEAIHLPWHVVTEILGHDHTGDADEDKRLVRALRDAGAPEWVKDAEGWIDEEGWGLIGPAISSSCS